MMPLRWDDALIRCRDAQESCVLVTVLGTSGSTPRNPGAKMVVTGTDTFDSIGGGQLEWLATAAARELLAQAALENAAQQRVEHFPLGQAARQCCGGAVAILLETIAPPRTRVALFGAGHVARALVSILAQLPFHVTWIDARRELLQRPEGTADASNLVLRCSDDPCAEVATLPAGVPALVMTHDHDLDLRLVDSLLRREAPAFVGLIGSEIKAQRFRMRLAAAGIDAARLAQLHCPVGLPEIPGKEPMAIAVAISAQLLQRAGTDVAADARDRAPGRQSGVPWRELRGLMDGLMDVRTDKENGTAS